MSRQFFLALKWIVFLCLVVLFAWKAFYFIDPDLGWHLRAGELVIANGWSSPGVDPWSYTMQGHEWINHEWFLDAILWLAWNHGYWPLVIFIFASLPLVVIGAWILRSQTALQLLLITIGSGFLLQVSGVRPQVLSILFFFLLYELLLSKSALRTRFLFLAPVLFFIWANLHGAFPAGVLLWAAVFAVSLFERLRSGGGILDKQVAAEALAFLLSVFATLATPYHLELWKEIIRSTTEPLIANVAEWQPALSRWQWQLPIFLGVIIALIGLFRKQLALPALLPAGIFFVLFMKHIRMAPYFLVTLFPVTEQAITLLYSKTKETAGARIVRGIEIGAVVLIVMVLCLIAVGSDIKRPYRPPLAAILALTQLEQTLSGNIFNEYGFGGWLIYENPQRRVFIDGRMPHWRDESGYSALEEYLALSEDPSLFHDIFSKYAITVAILSWEPRSATSSFETQPLPTWLEAVEPYINFLFSKPKTSLVAQLEKAGWCRVYQDKEAVILIASQFCLPGDPLAR